MRTLKSALDEHYKTEFNEHHVLLPWLIAYAASLISKFTIGEDGKTAHERVRGRRCNKALPEFGECILYAKYVPKRVYDKLEPQWEKGVFLGINDSSQELIIGANRGVVKSTEFRHRGCEEERWNFEEVNNIQGLPWQPDPNTASMDVQARVILPMEVLVTDDGEINTKPIIAR